MLDGHVLINRVFDMVTIFWENSMVLNEQLIKKIIVLMKSTLSLWDEASCAHEVPLQCRQDYHSSRHGTSNRMVFNVRQTLHFNFTPKTKQQSD
jgi:hypothetical protein